MGVSEAAAGVLLAACSALVAVNLIASGVLADRFDSSGHREIAVLATLGAVGCLVLVFSDSIPLYVVGMAIAMSGGWGWAGLAYFTVIRAHPEMPASATGMVLSANFTGTIVGPGIVGSWPREAPIPRLGLCARFS